MQFTFCEIHNHISSIHSEASDSGPSVHFLTFLSNKTFQWFPVQNYEDNFFEISSFSTWNNLSPCNLSMSKSLQIQALRTTILPVALPGCETWSHSKGGTLIQFVWGKYLFLRGDATPHWKKLRNKKLHSLLTIRQLIILTLTKCGKSWSCKLIWSGSGLCLMTDFPNTKPTNRLQFSHNCRSFW
jgi:hypothetical protein